MTTKQAIGMAFGFYAVAGIGVIIGAEHVCIQGPLICGTIWHAFAFMKG